MVEAGAASQLQFFLRATLALVIGVASGLVAAAAGLPLPWMLGPMIGTTIAALAGAPLTSPMRLRTIFLPILGVMLGSGIDASTLSAIGQWTTTLLLLLPFGIVTSLACYLFYRCIGRYDPVTAFFSSMLGGINESILQGGSAGGDEKRIAMAHATRLLAVVLLGVLFFGFVLGVTTGETPDRQVQHLTLQDWLILGGCALIGAPLGKLIRLPAALIIGPMLLSAPAHVSGLVLVAPPDVLVIAAQVVLGTVIGSRFIGSRIRHVGTDMLLGLGASLIMLAITVLFAFIVQSVTGTRMAHAFLAYSPGGLTEMSLLALAMGQEVAYVSVMHLARMSAVVLLSPLALPWLRRKQQAEA